jgi:hypothetical protein
MRKLPLMSALLLASVSAAPEEARQPRIARPANTSHARCSESDEAKARRIAARYGSTW